MGECTVLDDGKLIQLFHGELEILYRYATRKCDIRLHNGSGITTVVPNDSFPTIRYQTSVSIDARILLAAQLRTSPCTGSTSRSTRTTPPFLQASWPACNTPPNHSSLLVRHANQQSSAYDSEPPRSFLFAIWLLKAAVPRDSSSQHYIRTERCIKLEELTNHSAIRHECPGLANNPNIALSHQ